MWGWKVEMRADRSFSDSLAGPCGGTRDEPLATVYYLKEDPRQVIQMSNALSLRRAGLLAYYDVPISTAHPRGPTTRSRRSTVRPTDTATRSSSACASLPCTRAAVVAADTRRGREQVKSQENEVVRDQAVGEPESNPDTTFGGGRGSESG